MQWSGGPLLADGPLRDEKIRRGGKRQRAAISGQSGRDPAPPSDGGAGLRFPTRYPHWRWGMEYERLSKSHEYGLSKIYELVINNNPAIAYLLEGNSMVDQKLVMAHVFGHNDFFKNNIFFEKTNRKMIDGMANHAARVRRHMSLDRPPLGMRLSDAFGGWAIRRLAREIVVAVTGR